MLSAPADGEDLGAGADRTGGVVNHGVGLAYAGGAEADMGVGAEPGAIGKLEEVRGQIKVRVGDFAWVFADDNTVGHIQKAHEVGEVGDGLAFNKRGVCAPPGDTAAGFGLLAEAGDGLDVSPAPIGAEGRKSLLGRAGDGRKGSAGD